MNSSSKWKQTITKNGTDNIQADIKEIGFEGADWF